MLNLVLTEESGAAAAARQALQAENGELPETVRDDVLLLVSELVSNAVLHAGAGPERPLQVQLLRGPRWLVVTVSDEGPGFAWHPHAAGGAEGRNGSGGWGLFLVDQIADCWGVECTAVRGPRLVRDCIRGMTSRRTTIASAALFAISGLHVAWGLGASWPRIDREPASPGACFAVAGLLGVAAGLVAGRPHRAPRLSRWRSSRRSARPDRLPPLRSIGAAANGPASEGAWTQRPRHGCSSASRRHTRTARP